MIERERAQRGNNIRGVSHREAPKDFNVVLMHEGWKQKAVLVYGGEFEHGQWGPMLLFVEGKKRFWEKDALYSLLKVTSNRITGLPEAHMLRCAGTSFGRDKEHGGGTYE